MDHVIIVIILKLNTARLWNERFSKISVLDTSTLQIMHLRYSGLKWPALSKTVWQG